MYAYTTNSSSNYLRNFVHIPLHAITAIRFLNPNLNVSFPSLLFTHGGVLKHE